MKTIFRKMALALALVFSASVAMANEGFDVGPQATIYPVQGTAIADCQEMGGHIAFSRHFQCQGYIFTPESISYFVGSPGLEADTIQLVVTHENGKTVTEKQKYDAATGKSHKPFSLWGGSLFNKALMKLGQNHVKFQYLKGTQVVREGNFDFSVKVTDWVTCQTHYVTGTSYIGCQQQADICNRYFFSQQNVCGL